LIQKQWELGHVSASCAFRTNIYLSWPCTRISQFKACQICCQANLVYSLSFETKLHLDGLKTILLIHLKDDQRLIFHRWPSKLFLFHFQLSHCGLLYFHLPYNIFDEFHWLCFEIILKFSNYIHQLITQCLSSCNDVSEYHVLIIHTYNYIYETNLRPSLSLLVMHKGYQVKFHFKDSSTCINCIFREQSMFIKNVRILISISRKQWISLLSVLLHKSVTLLSNIDASSILSRVSQPKLFVRLGNCVPGKTITIVNMGFTIR